MKQAPIPEDEAERLAALAECEILDTLPERAYDDLTFIASQLCETPIALVSLVDEDRQWFKSRVGLGVAETPRALAFCAHAILEPDSLCVIEDARADERFADNPLVLEEPKIRFYAGAPLVTAGGHALGTLCVIDREPRRLDSRQEESLRALSRQVVAHLEVRRAARLLEIQSQQIQRSRNELASLCRLLEGQADAFQRDLHRAEIIQRSLLPRDAPEVRNFSVQTLYQPGRHVGGDLYDVTSLDDRHVALMIADASGHGVSAAMLSVLFKHRLRLVDPASGEPLSPAKALTDINEALSREVSAPGVFVTTVYGLLDTERQVLRMASAGHPPALLVHGDGSSELLMNTGPALGLYADAHFEEREIRLERGDRLLFYTDGLVDAVEGEAPTPAAVAARLHALEDGKQTLPKLLDELWRGGSRPERDDVTLLLLKATPGESCFLSPEPGPRALATSGEESVKIRYAETPEGTTFALRGRVTWQYSSALLDAATSVIEARRPLRIDLAHCEYLDSALLGTLHEIVERAEGASVTLHLHTASRALLEAFEELSMRRVIDHVVVTPLELPADATPLELPASDPRHQQLRLLHAHEVLAELSEDNRAGFSPVLDALRVSLSTPEKS